MTTAIPVLINRSGGIAAAKGGKLMAELAAAFAAADLPIDLRLLDGRDIGPAAAGLANRQLVVVGGGDGTLGCAADALLNGAAALGILPLGTRNHLARDLSIPLDLPGAAKLIATRSIRDIDVGRVNGHLFVNNASVGIYPDMVRLRDRRQEKLNLPKWLAAIPASWNALKRLRHHRLHLHAPGMDLPVVTPMLFVGNNHYELDAGIVGTRTALDDGMLCVLAVAARRRRALIGLAFRTLTGHADPERDFAAIGDVAGLTVTGGSHRIDIALDGELRELTMPLAFTIEARALRVVAPAA